MKSGSYRLFRSLAYNFRSVDRQRGFAHSIQCDSRPVQGGAELRISQAGKADRSRASASGES